jgi:transposase
VTMIGKPQIVDIDMAQVRRLLQRVEVQLGHQDYELVKGLLDSLLQVTRLVQRKGTTIARLRRLFGLTSSEKTVDVLAKLDPTPASSVANGQPDATSEVETNNDTDEAVLADQGNHGEPTPGTSVLPDQAKGHGRVAASAYKGASHIPVSHHSLAPGDVCPGCTCGRLYELKEPARFLRIVGQPPLTAVCWDCQRLRCNTCGAVFTARAPQEAQGSKYAETAAGMMAILRYGTGVPLNRLQRLQDELQAPVPCSTQWDVVNECVALVEPAYQELARLAAQGTVIHNDDTHMRILEFMGKRRARLLKTGQLPHPKRTGLFTTAVASVTQGGRIVALFFTGRQHGGENLSELLNRRATGLPPPIQMSDALSRNLPKGHKVIEANCLAHGRRKIVDEVDNCPNQCAYLLNLMGKVYAVDHSCRKQGLSAQQRLELHQRRSGPVMDHLQQWMSAQLADKHIEPNSGLGQAFNYLLKRWDKFTLFLREPGSPLDNNVCERVVKKAIQHRKNSLFYRSQHGAQVGDIWMTLIHTAELHGENPFHYLTELLRHPKQVAENPAEWLPWNYRETLARLEGKQVTD